MKAKIENFTDQYFAYMRRVGVYGQENYELMKKFKRWLNDNNYPIDSTVIYAVARDNPNTTTPDNCRYDIGMIVPETFNNSDLNLGVIENGRYIVFTLEHTAEAINEFWHSISSLLQKENYQIDECRNILERYDYELIQQELCEICVPIL